MTEPQGEQRKSIDHWLAFLSDADIPVLKHTARELVKLQQDDENIGARDITQVVIQDPMMTLRLLRYSQAHKHKHQVQDLVLVEQAIMMMGMTTFFSELTPQVLVEDMLKNNTKALTHLLKHIHRSHRAARYAAEWAAMLHDFHAEEVMVATLLHDLAEMLMWCFAPQEMSAVHDMQQADKALRSSMAQQQVFGFKLGDLEHELVVRWQLPPLLAKLISDSEPSDRRVQNVRLAVNFARHSANGWEDAALPDDYRDIANLLRVDTDKVKRLVGAPLN